MRIKLAALLVILAALTSPLIAQGTSAPAALSAMLLSSTTGDHSYFGALAAIHERRYADAVAALKRSETAFGAHPDVLTTLGFAYGKLGKADLAEAQYQKVLAAQPDHRGALEFYGELKLQRGDVAGARALLAQLDRICSFGCIEAEELRRWIAQKKS